MQDMYLDKQGSEGANFKIQAVWCWDEGKSVERWAIVTGLRSPGALVTFGQTDYGSC